MPVSTKCGTMHAMSSPSTPAFDAALFRDLPKAEVHVHLEGTFEPALLENWAREAGVAMPRPRERLLEFQGLADFLEFLDWACGLASTADRVAELARAFCQRLADDGTGYADLIINPTHWSAWHGRLRPLLDALEAGFREAEEDGLPTAGLCVSLLRTQTGDEAAQLVDDLVAWRHPRVVALSVDGNEATAGRTGPRFAQAFREAARSGLRRTVHAGESSGPEGVWDAIDWLGADRIDHGVRAIEDAKLMDVLAQRRIPLGICPSSNLALKVYPSLAAHPIDALRRGGVPVSINTDDPSLLSTSLPREYAMCASHFDWDEAVLRQLAGHSIDASFANEDVKARLRAQLAAWRLGG
jgi:adenosine deaminase